MYKYEYILFEYFASYDSYHIQLLAPATVASTCMLMMHMRNLDFFLTPCVDASESAPHPTPPPRHTHKDPK